MAQFRSGFPVFSVWAIRSCVFRSPHRLRKASRSRSSRCCSLTVAGAGDIPACQDPGELAADQRIVITDPSRPPREVDAELQRGEHARAADRNRCAAAAARSLRRATAPGSSRRRRSRSRFIVIAVARAQIAEPSARRGRSSRRWRSQSSRRRAGRTAARRRPAGARPSTAPASPSCRRRQESVRRRLRPGRCSSPPAACTRSACRTISQPPPSVRPAGATTTGTSAYRSPIVAPWNARIIRSTSSQLPSCASSRSSIRFAPAEKCSPSLPTTSAAKLSAASLTARRSMSMVSPPMAFIFEWNSTPSTPSPRSTRLAPAFFRTTRFAGAGRLEQRRTRIA